MNWQFKQVQWKTSTQLKSPTDLRTPLLSFEIWQVGTYTAGKQRQHAHIYWFDWIINGLETVAQVSSVYAYALFCDGLLCLYNRPVKIGFSKENPWQGIMPTQVFDILRASGKLKQEVLMKMDSQDITSNGDGSSYGGSIARQRSDSFQSIQCTKSSKQDMNGSLHSSHSSDMGK
eukprot:TRINITY_DN82350_c0_g1_i1.p2 TRINITY_DN82350_c0_g1~~TRINITY_DN82350_c0_g1_i1.p2  ORF type:complete len:175 (+),score=10.52 TRINITY_DN82350_c0_g1_i1:108-632(+)